MLSAFRATQSEWQAYDHYCHRISSILGGAFDEDLWKTKVIQIANTEPTIRHGVFALGHLFKHHDASRNVSECACDNCRQALRHFNKSIASYSQYLQQRPAQKSTEVTLLSCLIYICLETYRLNDRSAISLIVKGCGIISETIEKGTAAEILALEPRLVQSFDRLWLLSDIFGHHVPRPLSKATRISASFRLPTVDSFETARDVLHELTTFVHLLRVEVYRVQLSSITAGERSVSLVELQKEQHILLDVLRIWHHGFQHLVDQNQKTFFCPLRARSILSLNVQYWIIQISAAASMIPSEREGDDQLEEFRNLVYAAEESLTKFPAAEDVTNFSFEVCYLPGLYLTVRKCRDPTIRRKALELMRVAGIKENLWWKPELLTVAARVIELEEGLAFLNIDEPFSFKPLRFYDVLVGLNYRKTGKTFVDVRYLIYDSSGETDPDPQRRWKTVPETLTVED